MERDQSEDQQDSETEFFSSEGESDNQKFEAAKIKYLDEWKPEASRLNTETLSQKIKVDSESKEFGSYSNASNVEEQPPMEASSSDSDEPCGVLEGSEDLSVPEVPSATHVLSGETISPSSSRDDYDSYNDSLLAGNNSVKSGEKPPKSPRSGRISLPTLPEDFKALPNEPNPSETFQRYGVGNIPRYITTTTDSISDGVYEVVETSALTPDMRPPVTPVDERTNRATKGNPSFYSTALKNKREMPSSTGSLVVPDGKGSFISGQSNGRQKFTGHHSITDGEYKSLSLSDEVPYNIIQQGTSTAGSNITQGSKTDNIEENRDTGSSELPKELNRSSEDQSLSLGRPTAPRFKDQRVVNRESVESLKDLTSDSDEKGVSPNVTSQRSSTSDAFILPKLPRRPSAGAARKFSLPTLREETKAQARYSRNLIMECESVKDGEYKIFEQSSNSNNYSTSANPSYASVAGSGTYQTDSDIGEQKKSGETANKSSVGLNRTGTLEGEPGEEAGGTDMVDRQKLTGGTPETNRLSPLPATGVPHNTPMSSQGSFPTPEGAEAADKSIEASIGLIAAEIVEKILEQMKEGGVQLTRVESEENETAVKPPEKRDSKPPQRRSTQRSSDGFPNKNLAEKYGLTLADQTYYDFMTGFHEGPIEETRSAPERENEERVEVRRESKRVVQPIETDLRPRRSSQYKMGELLSNITPISVSSASVSISRDSTANPDDTVVENGQPLMTLIPDDKIDLFSDSSNSRECSLSSASASSYSSATTAVSYEEAFNWRPLAEAAITASALTLVAVALFFVIKKRINARSS